MNLPKIDFNAFIEKFVPENSKTDEYQYTLAKNVVGLSIAILIAALIFSAFYGLFGHIFGMIWIFVWGIFIISVPIILRNTGSIKTGAFITTFVMWIVQVGLSFSTGGVIAPNTMWFSTIPLLATVMGGMKDGIRWTFVTIVTVLALYFAEVFGFSFPVRLPVDISSASLIIFQTIIISGLVFFVGAFVVYSEFGKRNAFQAMQEAEERSKLFTKEVEQLAKDLENEKEAVEQKVRDAVQESEEQREYLTESISIILNEMKKFAEGDLTVQLEIRKQDELGKLYEGFNTAVENIRSMVEQLFAAIEMVKEVVSQIGEHSNQIAEGTKQQNSQIGDVTFAITGMTQIINENTESTANTASEAIRSETIAHDGGEVLGAAISKIKDVALVVSEATITIEKLSSSSDAIGQIISVIDKIAEQTNLLALNAAIEAARAGEAGRGFAIVADEVRKLAEQTGDATKEISAVIGTVQENTRQAVSIMETGNKEMQTGMELVNQTEDTLDQVVNSAGNVQQMVERMAAASEEQLATSEEITSRMEVISEVTNESAEKTSNIAVEANRLNELTEQLSQLIARFQIQ
ncbi:MAG: HAMP domain-containing protein [Anaerolineaceae bacterium]|nr:HAMP domain-containing protein [Anaerolineaceae bacterium]